MDDFPALTPDQFEHVPTGKFNRILESYSQPESPKCGCGGCPNLITYEGKDNLFYYMICMSCWTRTEYFIARQQAFDAWSTAMGAKK